MKTNRFKKKSETGARENGFERSETILNDVPRSATEESFLKDYGETAPEAFGAERNRETERADFFVGETESARSETNREKDARFQETDFEFPKNNVSDTENGGNENNERSEPETEETGGGSKDPKTELSEAERRKKIRDLKRAIRLFDAELKIIGFGGDPEKANLKEFAAEFID